MPAGGKAGQWLAKLSAADYDAGWADAPKSLPDGTQGDLLSFGDNGWEAKDPADALAPGWLPTYLPVAVASGGIEWHSEADAIPNATADIAAIKDNIGLLEWGSATLTVSGTSIRGSIPFSPRELVGATIKYNITADGLTYDIYMGVSLSSQGANVRITLTPYIHFDTSSTAVYIIYRDANTDTISGASQLSTYAPRFVKIASGGEISRGTVTVNNALIYYRTQKWVT